MKLLLTSAGFKNQKVYEQFLSMMKDSGGENVAIITTASVEWKERNKYAVLTKERLEKDGYVVSFVDVEREDPMFLHKFDAIYINGGNPLYLLHHLRNSNADNVLRDFANAHKIIVGSSAGSMVLGPDIEVVNRFTPEQNIVGMNDFTGLRLVPFLIFPHYEGERKENADNYAKSFPHEFIPLTDDQAILVEGDDKRLIE